MVTAAPKEGLQEVHKQKAWRKAFREQTRARGKRVIGVGWVDLNKGDDEHPNYRLRLVAKKLRAFALGQRPTTSLQQHRRRAR